MDSEQLAADAGISVVRREEQLRVGVERIPVERVRVSKRVVTETVTRTFEVRREELVVERLPIAPGALGEARPAVGPLEIVLYEEQIVVDTRLVPVERVRVDVARIVEQRPVSELLRHEEVVVEDAGTGDVTTWR